MTLDETLREIKAAMDKQDRTIRSVALAIGKHEQEVGQWFKGEHRPSFASLSALAAVVGLEIVLRKAKAS